MLTDFFRINLPYGIAKNETGAWFAFNREYLPIGFNDTTMKPRFNINDTSSFPIHTKYKKLTEKAIMELADNEHALQKDSAGNVIAVFFYDDRSNPVNNKGDKKVWDAYFRKIEKLSAFQVE